MKKKIIAFILCICLISSFCLQPAYAMGAEGAIIGGGAAAAGITLTMPQVALLVAAGFGLIYATQHADEIANGLNEALTNAANNIENGIEQLTTWKEKATTGFVALSSAAPWILETIKNWISGLYETNEFPSLGLTNVPSGQAVAGPQFWLDNPTTYKFNGDVTVLRASVVEETMVGQIPYYSLGSYFVAVSTTKVYGDIQTKTINGKTYYYKYSSSYANPRADTPLAGDNLDMYNALVGLPNYNELKSLYPDYSSVIDIMILGWVDGFFAPSNGNVCPDEKVGGIDNVMDQYGIDNIKVPDLDIGGSGLLAPDNIGTGSIDDVLNDILTRLKQQELTWSDYMADVAVGTPSVAIPQEDGLILDFPITDTGVSDTPIDTPVNPPVGDIVVPEGLEPFTISLKDFFPFCIPFDIADFVNVLCAEPEAPSFEWAFPSPDGTTYKMTIDLSPFDGVAQLLRNMELLLFCIGLALMTRNLIRG